MNLNSPILWLAVVGAVLGLVALVALVIMPTYSLSTSDDPGSTPPPPPVNGGSVQDPPAGSRTSAYPSSTSQRVPPYSARPEWQPYFRRLSR